MSTRSAAARAAARLPHGPGVYRFRDGGGQILYLGRASDLRSRVQSYWGDLRDRLHLTKMVAQLARVEAVACDSVHEAAWLERNLLEADMPAWNRTPGGAETAMYILVDTRPRTAGVRTSHLPRFDGVFGFGPFLGGTKARQAISGLQRAFPLSYTRDRLTGAERDIAATRGVGPQLRERLAEAIISALDGTNTRAARELLTAARDRAVAALNFELAARIHDELAALDWVTSVQRVTLDGGGDQQICGWADGLAVTFSIRGGRLNRWDLHQCGRSAVARASAATPPEWTAFAQRNAELAAALIRA